MQSFAFSAFTVAIGYQTSYLYIKMLLVGAKYANSATGQQKATSLTSDLLHVVM